MSTLTKTEMDFAKARNNEDDREAISLVAEAFA
jgi:hypothetical protein